MVLDMRLDQIKSKFVESYQQNTVAYERELEQAKTLPWFIHAILLLLVIFLGSIAESGLQSTLDNLTGMMGFWIITLPILMVGAIVFRNLLPAPYAALARLLGTSSQSN